MKKQIKRFSVHQTSKIIAIVNWVTFAVFGIPIGFLLLAFGAKQEALTVFGMLFVYLLFFYIITAICAFVYNLAASTFGGIEFVLSDEE